MRSSIGGRPPSPRDVPSFGSPAVSSLADPRLCVPVSRRVCPFREGVFAQRPKKCTIHATAWDVSGTTGGKKYRDLVVVHLEPRIVPSLTTCLAEWQRVVGLRRWLSAPTARIRRHTRRRRPRG